MKPTLRAAARRPLSGEIRAIAAPCGPAAPSGGHGVGRTTSAARARWPPAIT